MKILSSKYDPDLVWTLTVKAVDTLKVGIGEASTLQLVGSRSNGYAKTVFIPAKVDAKKKLVSAEEAEARKSLYQRQMANLHRDTLVAELIQWTVGGNIGKTVHAHLKAIVKQRVNVDDMNWKMGTTPNVQLSRAEQEAKYDENLTVAKVALENLELVIANQESMGLVLSDEEQTVANRLRLGLTRSIAENARPVSLQPKPTSTQPPRPRTQRPGEVVWTIDTDPTDPTAQTAQGKLVVQPPPMSAREATSTDAGALRPARTDLDRALEDLQANESEQRVLRRQGNSAENRDAMDKLKVAHSGLREQYERLLARSANVNTTTTTTTLSASTTLKDV
ncbi:hypothetical protein [Hydrogenophaga sp. BPS33]|uniref:hypothetical protein n=1 Tax=Hydrogenophaga sp. BPS33 TaxID=2651974 RepID=UPI00131FF527|nr:hypothetical protein [Hydrogenophaga sp. BPS33]QHE84048.1 hypothetical protein F9K07_03675 [Hydrogenophaga sp. BPS33]